MWNGAIHSGMDGVTSGSSGLDAACPDGSVGDQPFSVLATPGLSAQPPRGLPMTRLVSVQPTSSAYYAVTTIDARGRLADRSPLRILDWGPERRSDASDTAGGLEVVPQSGGHVVITRQGHLRIPVSVRNVRRFRAGDRLLVGPIKRKDRRAGNRVGRDRQPGRVRPLKLLMRTGDARPWGRPGRTAGMSSGT